MDQVESMVSRESGSRCSFRLVVADLTMSLSHSFQI